MALGDISKGKQNRLNTGANTGPMGANLNRQRQNIAPGNKTGRF